MDPSRRQFALWSTAALLAPTAMAGGKPGKPAKADKAAKIEELRLSQSVTARTDTEITVEIRAQNPSSRGMSVQLSVSECQIDGMEQAFGACWLNDEHPFSRRIMAPSFVDVGPKTTLAVAVLHLAIDPETAKKDGFAHVSISLSGPNFEVHTVALAPVPLSAEEPKPAS